MKSLLAVLLFLSACTSNSFLSEKNSAVDTPTFSSGDLTVVTSEVNYGPANGFLAQPAVNGNYPGVILIHEWWGLNDQIKDTAKILATNGYRVLAVDLYNGSVATTPDEARALIATVNTQSALVNMQQAVKYLKDSGSPTIASWGWCFGGGQSMNLATLGITDATVIYYGTLITDRDKLDSINAPILMVYGTEDTSTPLATAQELHTILNEIGVENELYSYEGVGHAFANPSNPSHDKQKAADAWQKTLAFLNNTLR